MTLPYSNATSGDRAIAEIQKILRSLGCSSVGVMQGYDANQVILAFTHRGRNVQIRASAGRYAAAWLRENPWTTRRRGYESDHRARALAIGQTAVYSILRDWVKGQVTAIEVGIMDFDAAFLSHILLADGRRVIDHASERHLLPAPTEE